MDLYRITQEKFSKDLSGNGARLYGGRWNSEGLFALYSSSTRALAVLETLVHSSFKQIEAGKYVILTLNIPDDAPIAITDLDGTEDWKMNEAISHGIGDRFLQSNTSLLLRVPSIIIEQEYNYVLNPLHSAMKDVKLVNQTPLHIDNRFYKAD